MWMIRSNTNISFNETIVDGYFAIGWSELGALSSKIEK